MANRPLMAHERALISAAVVFSVVPATRVSRMGNTDLMRLLSICDAVNSLPSVDKFQVEHGPVTHIYWAAADLVKAHRDSASTDREREQYARYLACHVFSYFEVRCVNGLRELDLPDHVPEPPKETVF